jgi:hypothetical protein
MNENYLNQLFNRVSWDFVASGSTINYPMSIQYSGAPFPLPIRTSGTSTVTTFNKKEVSFIKKEIPKFNFEESTVESTMSDEEFTNFQSQVLNYLPNWFKNSSYGIISDSPQYHFFDEFC